MSARHAIPTCRECGTRLVKTQCPRGCDRSAHKLAVGLLVTVLVVAIGLTVMWAVLSGVDIPRLPPVLADWLTWIAFVILAAVGVREAGEDKPNGRRFVLATLTTVLLGGLLLWWKATL